MLANLFGSFGLFKIALKKMPVFLEKTKVFEHWQKRTNDNPMIFPWHADMAVAMAAGNLP